MILVVIDKFTKYGHFIPLAHPFTAMQIAQVFMNQVYRLHGLPNFIISDRDKVFTSALSKDGNGDPRPDTRRVFTPLGSKYGLNTLPTGT